MREHAQCCELCRAVYECPNCGRREHQHLEGGYASSACCELNVPGGPGCYEAHPRPPRTFPSVAFLVGFYCPAHGWSLPPHLRQTSLF